MDNTSIKSFIEDLLKSMGVTFDAVEVHEDPETLEKIATIKTKEQTILIGENGENFYALTHIIRRILNKDPEHPNNISIEVNDYKKSLLDSLKIKATMLANRATDMKIDVEMDPMSSYERLIVHEALKGIPHIKTESMGDGRDRKVVIKYVENSL